MDSAELVKFYRAQRGLSVAEAASKAGLSVSMWYKLESGARWFGSEITLTHVAEALEVPARWLISDPSGPEEL